MMVKAAVKTLFAWMLCVLISGCTAMSSLQLVVGNRLASHSWQGDKTHTTMSFELLNQHTIVTASIDGVHNLRMVLDTGAAATVLFETANTQPMLDKLGKKVAFGGIGKGDKTDMYFINDVDLTLGEVTISGLTTVFIKHADNPIFSEPEVTYIDGVIGYDLFSRFITEIDFTQQKVSISEGPINAKPGYQPLPMKVENNLAWVDIAVHGNNKSATLPVIFDTGGVGSLLIAGNPSLPPNELLYRGQASGLGGDADITVNRLQNVSFGHVNIANVIASVYQDPKAKNSIMGTGLINRFNLVIDYPSQQLFISPNTNYHKVDYVSLFGATLLPHTQGAFIKALRSGTKAVELGFQERDVIISVNGQDIDYKNYDDQTELLSKLNAVKEICYLRNDASRCVFIEKVNMFPSLSVE